MRKDHRFNLRQKNFFVSAAVFTILLSGCASAQSLRNSQDEIGSSQVVRASYDAAFKTARNVLVYQGADIVEENQEKKYILAKQGVSGKDLGLSYGEILGVYFEPVSSEMTRVKMVQKNRFKLSMGEVQQWDIEFFKQLVNQLQLRNDNP